MDNTLNIVILWETDYAVRTLKELWTYKELSLSLSLASSKLF
jgi:hypothetical protein